MTPAHHLANRPGTSWTCSCGYTAKTLRAVRRHITLANRPRP